MRDPLESDVQAAAGPRPEPLKWRRLEIWLPIAIVALDQLTKAIVREAVPLHTSVTIIPGVLDFTHVQNTGAAFGILNTADFRFKSAVLGLVAVAALVGVAIYAA